jgi:HAD superfamily phosphatase (TIGR01668 family)
MTFKKIKKLLLPDFYFESLKEIEPGMLKELGKKAVLIDLDNTLVPRNQRGVSEEVKTWLRKAQKEGLSLCIVSNNWEGRVRKVADELGLPLVAPAGKPRKKAFLKALSILKVDAFKAAVVGDQIFTDVFGGNRLGLLTVLVKPLSGRELVHTRFLRLLERKILTRNQPKNHPPLADNIKGVAYDNQLEN